jgi:hypothetical protein
VSGGEGYTTDGQVLPTLAAAFAEQAQVLLDAITPFQEGAIDQMEAGEAWGPAGAEERAAYLAGVPDFVEALHAVVGALQQASSTLVAGAAATDRQEQAVTDLFGGLAARLGDGG